MKLRHFGGLLADRLGKFLVLRLFCRPPHTNRRAHIPSLLPSPPPSTLQPTSHSIMDLGATETPYLLAHGSMRGRDLSKYASMTKPGNRMEAVHAVLERFPERAWVATPKIHGANGQVHLIRTPGGASSETEPAAGESSTQDRVEVLFASRRRYLTPDESFHGFQRIAADLHLERLFLEFPDATEVRVYGEVYGGGYPHPEVPRVDGVAAVQKGVYYHPRVKYIVFDIKVDAHYLPWDHMTSLCRKLELPFVDRVEDGPVGSFEEVYEWARKNLDQPVVNVTGDELPPLPDNVAEGWVIRPQTMSGPKMKVKSVKFGEIIGHKVKKAKQFKKREDNEAASTFRCFIPDARLEAVFSKFTPDELTLPHTRELGTALFEDVMKEASELVEAAGSNPTSDVDGRKTEEEDSPTASETSHVDESEELALSRKLLATLTADEAHMKKLFMGLCCKAVAMKLREVYTADPLCGAS